MITFVHRLRESDVTEPLCIDRLRIVPKARKSFLAWQSTPPLPSPPGGAVSFHPGLLTRVITEDGKRQRRLSEVGLMHTPKKENQENEDPDETSPPCFAVNIKKEPDLKEETSAAGEARSPFAVLTATPTPRQLGFPESTHKNTPLFDLTTPPISPPEKSGPSPPFKQPRF